ncbi:MAG: GntR family transcriptional regulator [Actinobacteria bacterium]|nr:GntR family transcriptional regulator [Actinomycetota bacterium]
MSTESLQRSSLRGQAAEVIRARIVSGQFAPGEIYSANTIAEQLGVSATPIREAMLDLANAGLVEPIRNRGFRILTMEDKDLDEVGELRLLLEPSAMLMVVERAEDAELEALTPAVEKIEATAEERDVAAFLVADKRFHSALLELTRNERLARLVGQLRDQTRLLGLQPLAFEGKLFASAHEHRELLEHLCARDGAAAEKLMRSHVEHTRGLWAGIPEADGD